MAARFLSRKDLRAAQMIIWVRPTPSLCVNSTLLAIAQRRIERERQHARHQIDFLLRQHRRHGGERRLDRGVVAFVVESVLVQHRLHRDIDAAAGGVGGNDLALQILDLGDAAVLAHEELVGIIARRAVLKLVGDDFEIVEAGILDGEPERRIGEIADFQFVDRHRRDHRRRALIAHGLEIVGRAPMLGEILLLGKERRPVRHRHYIGAA